MAHGSFTYSNAKLPAPIRGLKPVTPPYAGYAQLNPQPAAAPSPADAYAKLNQPPLSPGDAYAKLNPGAPPPDALGRTIANGQNTFTPSAGKPSVAPPTPAPNGPPTPGAFDLSTDPIVQKIRALNAHNYGSAVATADAARKEALIAAGFGDLANSAQFGSLENPVTGDKATALAASQNPFSTAANLAHTHAGNVNTIDQGDNAQNLYYSSTRGNDLGAEGRNYLGNEASAQDQVRQALTQILQGLVTEKQTEAQNEADAIETARQNAISNALASGQTFIGYDANGNPIFGPGKGGGGTTGTGATPVGAGVAYSKLHPHDAAPPPALANAPGFKGLNVTPGAVQGDALTRYLTTKLGKG